MASEELYFKTLRNPINVPEQIFCQDKLQTHENKEKHQFSGFSKF